MTIATGARDRSRRDDQDGRRDDQDGRRDDQDRERDDQDDHGWEGRNVAEIYLESISNRGLRGLLLKFDLRCRTVLKSQTALPGNPRFKCSATPELWIMFHILVFGGSTGGPRMGQQNSLRKRLRFRIN